MESCVLNDFKFVQGRTGQGESSIGLTRDSKITNNISSDGPQFFLERAFRIDILRAAFMAVC